MNDEMQIASNHKLNNKQEVKTSKVNQIKWTEIPLTFTNKDTNFPGLEVTTTRFSN